MSRFIIMPETSRKEKWNIISDIGTRKLVGRVWRAYDNLFGSFPPHRSILRLEHFNSKALSRDYRRMIRRILLGEDLQYYYKHPDRIQAQFERDQDTWDNWNILEPWFLTTDKPNPHHIIPRSRGWNDNWKNTRFMDRHYHDDFHAIFHNLTPAEQFIVMMIIHKRILNPDFMHDMKLLNKQIRGSERYREGALSKSH